MVQNRYADIQIICVCIRVLVQYNDRLRAGRPKKWGVAIRRGRGFLSLNLNGDELRMLPSFIIQWLPGIVFSGVRESGHDSLRSAQTEMHRLAN